MVVERGEKRKGGTRRGWEGREVVHGLKILKNSGLFLTQTMWDTYRSTLLAMNMELLDCQIKQVSTHRTSIKWFFNGKCEVASKCE